MITSSAHRERFRSRFLRKGFIFFLIPALVMIGSCSQSGVDVSDGVGIRLADEAVASSRVVHLSLDAESKSRSYSISIDNNGEEELLVERLQYTNPEHFTLYSDDIPGPVPAGESAVIEVNFHPRYPGNWQSEVRLYSDSVDSPITFDIRGTSR